MGEYVEEEIKKKDKNICYVLFSHSIWSLC